EVGEPGRPVLARGVVAMDCRVRWVGAHELAPRGYADHPRRHAVWVQRVLVRSVIPRGEHHGNPVVVHGLRRLADRVLGIERAARPPGVVHDLDVVVPLVVEDVVEPGECEEEEEDITRADADALRPWSDARVVARRGGAESGRDPGDVSAVAPGGLAGRQALGEDGTTLLLRLRVLARARQDV